MNLTLSLCKWNLTSSKLNKNLVCYVSCSPVPFPSTGLDFQGRTGFFGGVQVGSRVEHTGLTGDPALLQQQPRNNQHWETFPCQQTASKLFQLRPALNPLVAASRDSGPSGLVTDALTPLRASLCPPRAKRRACCGPSCPLRIVTQRWGLPTGLQTGVNPTQLRIDEK